MTNVVDWLAGSRWLARYTDIEEKLAWLIRRCGECGWCAFRWQRRCSGCYWPEPIPAKFTMYHQDNGR